MYHNLLKAGPGKKNNTKDILNIGAKPEQPGSTSTEFPLKKKIVFSSTEVKRFKLSKIKINPFTSMLIRA
jgi:hypothetical protein